MADIFKRTRDRIINLRPQEKISFEEWEAITDKWAKATSFMKEENPLYQMMKVDLAEAENMIMENRLREVHEEHTITETFKKIFVTPKKIQDDEVIGQIKYLRDFLNELKSWIEFKEEAERKEGLGITVIERNRDK